MAALDFNIILNEMISAGKASFSSKWPKIKDLATTSFKKLSLTLVNIEEMRLAGTITEAQAKLMVDMDKNSFKIVLLSVEGLGLLAVEDALNAALNVIRKAVNTAVGFILL